MKYNRSICSTCRYRSSCVLTTTKNAISSCSEYLHIFDDEREAIIFNELTSGAIKTRVKRQQPEMHSV